MRITQDNPKFTFIFVIPIPKALTRPSSCLERQIAMAENKNTVTAPKCELSPETRILQQSVTLNVVQHYRKACFCGRSGKVQDSQGYRAPYPPRGSPGLKRPLVRSGIGAQHIAELF